MWGEPGNEANYPLVLTNLANEIVQVCFNLVFKLVPKTFTVVPDTLVFK